MVLLQHNIASEYHKGVSSVEITSERYISKQRRVGHTNLDVLPCRVMSCHTDWFNESKKKIHAIANQCKSMNATLAQSQISFFKSGA